MQPLDKQQKRLLILLGAIITYAIFDISTNWNDYAVAYGDSTYQSDSINTSAIAEAENFNPNLNQATSVKIEYANLDSTYKKKWGRSPFALTAIQAKSNLFSNEKSANNYQAKTLVLQGINYSKNASMAIIDHKAVAVGDNVSGFKVTKISATKVWLKNDLEKIVLTF